ncbi:MAG: hypothetical protein RR425_02705 [Erysipelotrichales bacterium]
MKKIVALFSLVLLLFGCFNKEEVNIKDFDISKADNVELVKKDKENNSLQGYGILNKNYTVVDKIGKCSFENQFDSDTNSKLKYYFINKEVKGAQYSHADIYLKDQSGCNKIKSLKYIHYGPQGDVYNDALYLNDFEGGYTKITKDKEVIFKNGNESISGLSMDNKTKNLYFISSQDSATPKASLVKYNQEGKLLEKVDIDNDFGSTFIKDNKISIVGAELIKPIENGSSQDYDILEGIVETYDIDKVFEDAKDHKGDIKKFKDINGGFHYKGINDNFISFGADDKEYVCDYDLTECTAYPQNTHTSDGDYVVIDKEKDSNIYIHKLGTNEIEKVIEKQKSSNMFFKGKEVMFFLNGKDGKKMVKYALK